MSRVIELADSQSIPNHSAQSLVPTTINLPKFRKGCAFRQFYGYSSEGSQSVTFYDLDWETNNYFISSSKTAFKLQMLQKFDAELLLGQVSYSQKSEIYNYSNGYPVKPKKYTTLELPDRFDLYVPFPYAYQCVHSDMCCLCICTGVKLMNNSISV